MYKVFIVEDEVIVREGLRDNIPWEQYGFLMAGEAGDGEIALPLIRRERPDVLITDIRMPFMDGLSLCRMVKEELPDIKILILSGYDDFEYARNAIEIGVDEYLTKPVTRKSVTLALERIIKKLEAEREKEDLLYQQREEMKEYEQFLRRRFFEDIFSGSCSVSQIYQKARQLGLDMTGPFYRVMLLDFYTADADESGGYENVSSRRSSDRSRDDLSARGSFDRSRGELSSRESFDRSRGELSSRESFDRSRGERSSHSFFEQNRNDLPSGSTFERNLSPAGSVTDPFILERQRENLIRYFLRHPQFLMTRWVNNVLCIILRGDTDTVRRYTQKAMEELADASEQSGGACQYFLCYSAIVERPSRLKECYEQARQYFSCRYMNTQVSVVTEDNYYSIASESFRDETGEPVRTDVRDDDTGDILAKTLDYIHAHYTDETISLHTAAASVNVSPGYLSALFSQKMGQTFVEYITSKRIDKAKQLLRTTSEHTSAIAALVGYKDPNYFRFVFKKTTGCTPREYRR